MARSISFGIAIALALAACGDRAPTGPAWPKSQDPEKDGGESIAPRETAAAVAAIEKSDDDKPTDAAKPAEPKPAPDGDDKPAVPPTAPTPWDTDDEIPITEEIIIEVEVEDENNDDDD